MSYYKMHRGWMENRVFRNAQFSRREAWAWLIENAVWQEEYKILNPKGELTLKRGQLSYSVSFMAEAWKRPKAWVFRVLKLFETCSMIVTATETGQNVITICNYGQYQVTQSDNETAGETETERQRNDSETNTKNLKNFNNSKGEGYAFSGSVINLKWDSFSQWEESYPAIPDLTAELQGLDDYYAASLSEKEKKGWYFRTSGALKNANARYLEKERNKPAQLSTLSDDEYNRRQNDMVTTNPFQGVGTS